MVETPKRTTGTVSIDALLPSDIAVLCENAGVTKAGRDTFSLSFGKSVGSTPRAKVADLPLSQNLDGDGHPAASPADLILINHASFQGQ
ncbi:MAG TPA: hypothetical protein VH933_07255 [Aestuariivirgaceae bacterium]|jgi:hypothetical protein